jgi:hypothetical protein
VAEVEAAVAVEAEVEAAVEVVAEEDEEEAVEGGW